MILRRLHLVVLTVLIAMGSVSAHGAVSGTVTGMVCDSTGIPQIGAQVQLLRPDLTVIASVYTDGSGRFTIPSVVPGRYAVKAMGVWFLPSLRENVRVRSKTIVNLTLNSLYEVMQWLPAEPRAGNAQKDDWAWTLRSAANRPLLRWLEDGPLVVVSDNAGAHPRLKARLIASGQEGAFGESGERISASIEETPSDSRELLARVDFAPGTDAGMESMLGFRQDLGFAGSVESVAAIAIHPEVDAGGSDGLDEAALRTWETLHLGDEFEAEVGANPVLVRLSGPSSQSVFSMLPFAAADWRDGHYSVRYSAATMLPAAPESVQTEAQSRLPAVSARNGDLEIEHGLHQELSWERRTDQSSVTVLVFHDRINNSVVEAMSHFAAGDTEASMVMLDSLNGLIHAAGPEFSTTGVAASFEHSLPGGNHLCFNYANGEALLMPSALAGSSHSALLAQVLAGVSRRRAQSYSLSLSGTLDGTGTHWQASYRWQPEETVTQVAPFAADAYEPYLNLRFRQPIHLRREGSSGFDAMVDMRNLLAQGYRPYLLSDGSLLIFAQDQRGFRAGLAFNF